MLAIDARKNQLLALLPPDVFDRLVPQLELVPLQLGKSIYEPGDQMQHVYFPIDAIISLLYVLEDGASSETAMVGNDGIVGIAIFMGGASTSSRAVVISAGDAFRLSASTLFHEFETCRDVRHVLLRYTQALITQMTQNAVCIRHHSLDQQFCRWLLLSHDLLPTNELRMTHALISSMLGVRREGVTEAAMRLQAAGVIRYSRGHIFLIDRRALEARVCECYAVVKAESERLHSKFDR